jgi:hypothetical protein
MQVLKLKVQILEFSDGQYTNAGIEVSRMSGRRFVWSQEVLSDSLIANKSYFFFFSCDQNNHTINIYSEGH